MAQFGRDQMKGQVSDHLSTQLLERLGERRLEPRELLALDDHVSTCAACRDRLREMQPRREALFALRASLQTDKARPGHLRQEQLMAYTQGRLDEVDHELVESHLESCAQCATRAQELAHSAGHRADLLPISTHGQTSPPAPWTRLSAAWDRFLSVPLALRVAATVAMTTLLAIAVMLLLQTGTDRREIVEHPPAPKPSDAPQQGPQPEAPAPILLALKDGPEQITLEEQNNVTGLESVDHQRVKTALTTGRVQRPGMPRELLGSSAPTMGRPGGSAFALLYPVGRIDESDRPTFHWRPLAGSVSYQVTIADPEAGYKEVATSPELRDTKWKVDRRLERGRVYSWQVIARTDGGEEKAPEAKFKVLERAKANEVARAKRAYAGRHLVLGLVYAEAGLIDEAEREFMALVRDNPQSPIAKNLLDDLRAKRRKR
jgi:anti-sigma factor RsiW